MIEAYMKHPVHLVGILARSDGLDAYVGLVPRR